MSSNRTRSSRARSSQSRKGTQTDPSNASSQTRPTTYSSKDAAFEQALIDANFYPEGYDENEPDNVEELTERFNKHRPSLSPSSFSPENFLEFKRKNREAKSEAAVMNSVFPMILGKETMPSGQNYPFNNLEPLASNISNPKPDYFNGSRPKQVYPTVRKDLGKYIVPSTDDSRPLLPNFFVEAKGPTGSAAEMKMQITQDIAVGTRGMHKMQSYGQSEPIYDGNAYTIGSTYHSGTSTLQLYAMHPNQPAVPDGQPEYHMAQLTAFAMTANAGTFRKGAAAFRNAQDWAKERRDEFIARTNEMAARFQQPQQEGEGEEEQGAEEEEEETEEEDEQDAEEEEEGEKVTEEEDEPATLTGQYMHSFTSPSQISTRNEYSSSTNIALAESDTSLDEFQTDFYKPSAKRSSTSRHYPQRHKRRTGKSSNLQDEESK